MSGVAVVTGSGRGIGFSLAKRLAKDGFSVLIADIDRDLACEARDKIQYEFSSEVQIFVGDIVDQNSNKEMVEYAVEHFGGIDVLVNNAGGGVISPFLEHTPESLHTTISRNLWTTIWSCWHVLPFMVAKTYGRIVNIGADSVRNGLWNHAAYNAAKGGVHGLTSGLAREFAQQGITVNTVAPCAVSTPQLAEIGRLDKDMLAKYLSVIPMGRAADMDEVASAVSYLASEEARYITGQVISVNGGSTML